MTRGGVALSDIRDAAQRLSGILAPTPLVLNPWLSRAHSCRIHLKLENTQPIGSFKIRGALARISRLSAAERRRGVVAASAGNHAQGVAWAARRLGVRAWIVMPRGAPIVKVANTRSLGAEVVLEGENYDGAMAQAAAIARKDGRILIHGFEDPDVIAGQGTLGLEILEELPDPDAVFVPVGGGGLAAGIAIVLKELRPRARLFGCQAAGAASMARALKLGRQVRLDRVDTFADGIAIPQAGEKARRILAQRLDGMVLVDDEQIAAAVLELLEKAKILSEGAGAVPLAALERVKAKLRGRNVVLVVSGGNIDVNILGRIIERGLIRAGRLVRVNVLISDRPGSLAALAALIARQGASVVQAIHDRSEPFVGIGETGVELTLETRGPDHSKRLLAALRGHVRRLAAVR